MVPSNIAEHVNHLTALLQMEKERLGYHRKIVFIVPDQGTFNVTYFVRIANFLVVLIFYYSGDDWAFGNPITQVTIF